MTDTTPPLHPLERELLQGVSTLVVTVESDEEFHDSVHDAIGSLEAGEPVDATPTLSFANYEDLLGTLTPSVLELIAAVRREEPESINETARVVDRDVKNVHEELTRLAQLGIVYFEEEGRSKRPVVWFDELVIDLPFESKDSDSATAIP
jgi:predicted transcriptional regulator